jgi:Domain of unknown function (DUF4166)
MTAPTLFARILGASFECLSPVLQRIHDARTAKRYVGRCDIRGGGSWAARAIARVARLPLARADVPLEVTILSTARTEDWTRKFGAHRMQSMLLERNRRLQERLGPILLTFELAAEEERIVWSLRSARLMFVPLPLTWLLTCAATEAIDNGRYGFDVSAHVRGIGLIVHYKGWLVDSE